LERWSAWLLDAGRLVFPPRLVRRHFPCLRRTNFSTEHLHSLKALPRVFVVVPDADERPSRPRVLDVRVVQVSAIRRTVVVNVHRYVKVADLLAVRIPDHIVELATEITLRPVLRIPDHLVDEVTEMQNEAKAIAFRGALVLVDHPPVGVLRARVGVL